MLGPHLRYYIQQMAQTLDKVDQPDAFDFQLSTGAQCLLHQLGKPAMSRM